MKSKACDDIDYDCESEDDDDDDDDDAKSSKPDNDDEEEEKEGKEETESEAETDAEDDEEFLSDDEGDNNVVASTKIRYLMKILKRECSDYKFIVFSFFTSMLDKIEPFLKREGIGFSRYDGGMRNDLREASLNKLRNHSGTRILLCSLRAGALGLNLTAASRVVLLEPFWNPVSTVLSCVLQVLRNTLLTLNPVRRRTSHRPCPPSQPDS